MQYSIDICPYCRTDINNTNYVRLKSAQVFDISQLKIEVTEYQILEKICPDCGNCCSADLPEEIKFG